MCYVGVTEGKIEKEGKMSFSIFIFIYTCNMYDVYLFNMLFTKFLLTQILEILMVNKLL